jgi:hypothetical protein
LSTQRTGGYVMGSVGHATTVWTRIVQLEA